MNKSPLGWIGKAFAALMLLAAVFMPHSSAFAAIQCVKSGKVTSYDINPKASQNQFLVIFAIDSTGVDQSRLPYGLNEFTCLGNTSIRVKAWFGNNTKESLGPILQSNHDANNEQLMNVGFSGTFDFSFGEFGLVGGQNLQPGQPIVTFVQIFDYNTGAPLAESTHIPVVYSASSGGGGGTVQDGGICNPSKNPSDCAQGLTCIQFSNTCSTLGLNDACDTTCSSGLTCNSDHLCTSGGNNGGNNGSSTGGNNGDAVPGNNPILLTNPLGASCKDLTCPATAVINFLFTIAIPLCGIMLLVGGFQMMTAAGDPEKFGKGKKTILYAVIGFVVILLAGSVAALIQSVFKGS